MKIEIAFVLMLGFALLTTLTAGCGRATPDWAKNGFEQATGNGE